MQTIHTAGECLRIYLKTLLDKKNKLKFDESFIKEIMKISNKGYIFEADDE